MTKIELTTNEAYLLGFIRDCGGDGLPYVDPEGTHPADEALRGLLGHGLVKVVDGIAYEIEARP